MSIDLTAFRHRRFGVNIGLMRISGYLDVLVRDGTLSRRLGLDSLVHVHHFALIRCAESFMIPT